MKKWKNSEALKICFHFVGKSIIYNHSVIDVFEDTYDNNTYCVKKIVAFLRELFQVDSYNQFKLKVDIIEYKYANEKSITKHFPTAEGLNA